MYEGKLACRSEVTSYACGEQMIGQDPRSMDNRVLPDMTCWIEIHATNCMTIVLISIVHSKVIFDLVRLMIKKQFFNFLNIFFNI